MPTPTSITGCVATAVRSWREARYHEAASAAVLRTARPSVPGRGRAAGNRASWDLAGTAGTGEAPPPRAGAARGQSGLTHPTAGGCPPPLRAARPPASHGSALPPAGARQARRHAGAEREPSAPRSGPSPTGPERSTESAALRPDNRPVRSRRCRLQSSRRHLPRRIVRHHQAGQRRLRHAPRPTARTRLADRPVLNLTTPVLLPRDSPGYDSSNAWGRRLQARRVQPPATELAHRFSTAVHNPQTWGNAAALPSFAKKVPESGEIRSKRPFRQAPDQALLNFAHTPAPSRRPGTRPS